MAGQSDVAPEDEDVEVLPPEEVRPWPERKLPWRFLEDDVDEPQRRER